MNFNYQAFRFCNRCNLRTDHDLWSDCDLVGESTAGRLLAGIATMGISEAVRNHYKQCRRCGLKTRS